MTASPPAASATPPAGAAFVIRCGHVITMDDRIGDLPGADVHVRDGRIAAVGPSLPVPAGTAELDASGMIVAPGLVETHWHLWNTLLRSMSAGPPGPGYFRVSLGLGAAYQPEDTYWATMLACAEAAESGITTVHDWSHNVRSPAHAEASLRALAESGLRARFSYGCAAGQRNDELMDLVGLRRLREEWKAWAEDGRLSLGVACRGLGGSDPYTRVPSAIYRAEIGAARELGLPVTLHACGPRSCAGQIAALGADGLLGPDVQVVHANCAGADEVAMLADAGSPVSVSPWSELLIGYGPPRTARLLAAGATVGLSVDTTVITGDADMFSIMKVTQAVANGEAGEEFALSARQVLALATIDGARSLGLADVTGSLTPGKRADIIMVAPGRPNLAVLTDPVHMLVTAAQPADVDTVIVDGRVLKRGGRPTAVDLPLIAAEAGRSLARLRAAGGRA